MRFFCVLTHDPTKGLPTEAQMMTMGQLIAEGMQAGWLLECEGVTFGAAGVRLQKRAGSKVTVTDGPFAETKEVLGGYALVSAASQAEAVERAQSFLEHVDHGTWELYPLFEMPSEEGP